MNVVEELADALAKDTIEASERMDNPQLIMDVAKAVGARSTTAEEAYLTAVRIRIAAATGRKYLEQRIAQFEAEQKDR